MKNPFKQIKQQPRWLQYVLRTLMITFIAVVVILGIAIIWVYSNQEKLKGLFVKELNTYLNTPIQVKDMDITVFEHFPDISFCLTDITAQESGTHVKKKDLLKAEHLSFNFNIWNILSENYKVKNIVLANAFLDLKVFKNGTSNFDIFKLTDSTRSGNFLVNLHKITLKNVQVKYSDSESNIFLDLHTDRSFAKGNFSNTLQDIKLKGDVFCKNLMIDDISYLKNKNIELNTHLKIDTDKELISIYKEEFLFQEKRLAIEGDIRYDNSNFVDLHLSGKDLALSDLISEFPDFVKEQLKSYKSKGILDFSMHIKGSFAGTQRPDITANVGLKNGELYHSGSDTKLGNLSFTAAYSNGKQHAARSNTLIVKQIQGKIKGSAFSGNFSISDFTNPLLECQINTRANLEDIKAFLQSENITKLNGQISADIYFKGLLQASAENFEKSEAKGKITFNNVSITAQSLPIPIQNLNGNLSFEQDNIVIQNITGVMGKTDINLSGNIKKIFPFLTHNSNLLIEGNLQSNYIAVDEFMGASMSSGNADSSSNIMDRISLNLQINAKEALYKKIQLKNVQANILYKKDLINVNHLQTDIFDGNISGDLIAKANEDKTLQLSGDVALEKINVNKLFYSLDDFGQKIITEKNLKGIISTLCKFIVVFDAKGNIIPEKFSAEASAVIDNGALLNFEPMKALSSFIKEETLKNVQFATLQNNISIVNQKIYIPEMQITSNAMNLNISGEHGFDNSINYKLKIKLSELLSRKRKERKIDSENWVDEDGSGRMSVYVNITGTVDNPIIKYGLSGGKSNLQENLKKEQENLKQIMKENAPWMKTSEETKQQKEEWKQRESGKYIINWEEEKKPATPPPAKPAEQPKFKVEFE